MINAASHEMKPVERVSQSGATTKLKLNTETQKEGEEEELLENLLSHSSVCPARRKDKENYLFYVLSQTFQSDFPTQIQVMTPWGAEKKKSPRAKRHPGARLHCSKLCSSVYKLLKVKKKKKKSGCGSSSRPGVPRLKVSVRAS